MIDEVLKLKAAACTLRLRILHLLSIRSKGLFVCTITTVLHEQQYNVSKHLSILKEARLVTDQRKGKSVMYRINWDESLIIPLVMKMDFSTYDLFLQDEKCLTEMSNSINAE